MPIFKGAKLLSLSLSLSLVRGLSPFFIIKGQYGY
jgi:hypothetical protein